MKKNVGAVDKVFRLLIALIIITLVITKVVLGAISILLLLLAVVLILTSLFGFCPLYRLLGIRTCKRTENKVTE